MGRARARDRAQHDSGLCVAVAKGARAQGAGDSVARYALCVDDTELDSTRFGGLMARARDSIAQGRAGPARELLGEAIALWRGPPLAEFSYESFAQGEVARLEEMGLEAVELRIDADLALGGHASLVGELEQLIAMHPFRERLRGQFMLALYRSGRQAEALDAYRSARQTLVEELGIEPGPALRQLEQGVLGHDPKLNPTPNGPSVTVLAAEPAPAGNLPPELTTLFGRDRDLDRVADMVGRYPLVTVVGPGGVGKTRVALQVARTVADRFQHGVWFVDLGAIGRAGDVAGAVSSAVGISDRPGSTALDTVVGELRERSLLLVLDNCEHVLTSAAEATARLVTACDGLQVLATTREPLGIAGERVARLEPLATTTSGSEPPAAVALFLDRAASHGVSWAEPDNVLDTIAEICERLDGIPLAIELAAARTRAISPAELLARLGDRLRLLAGPSHWSVRVRQQTLEATIEWSYELLSSEEQATLRRLSVFRGGFSLSAAAAVCADIGDELDTIERLTALVDRSVVSTRRRDDTDRYRLLESISLFGEQRLRDQGEENAARDRQARFFLEFAQGTSDQPAGPEPEALPAGLDAEQDNLTAALEWCLDGDGDPTVGAMLAANLGFHWTCRGRSNLAKRWFDRALERRDLVTPTALAAVQSAYTVLAYSTGEMDKSETHAAQAVAIARGENDDELLAEALGQLAFVQATGVGTDATTVAAELRSLQPRLSSPRAQVMALLGTAQVALATGHPDRARVDASNAREIARRAGDHLRAAMSGYWLAYALALDCAIPAARAALREGMQDAVHSGYQLLVVDNLVADTSLALADDDLETARQLLPQAVAMLREQQRWKDLGSRLHVAAAVELGQASPKRSAVLLGAGRRLTEHLDLQDELLLPELADLRDQLSARLGKRAFENASERGAEMSLDDIAELLAGTEQTS